MASTDDDGASGSGAMVILYVTFPTEEEAIGMSRHCIAERLAACANIIRIRSVFRWDGAIHDSGEYVALFKTSSERAEALRREIEGRHGYEVPCILEFRPDGVNPPFLDWLLNEVK